MCRYHIYLALICVILETLYCSELGNPPIIRIGYSVFPESAHKEDYVQIDSWIPFSTTYIVKDPFDFNTFILINTKNLDDIIFPCVADAFIQEDQPLLLQEQSDNVLEKRLQHDLNRKKLTKFIASVNDILVEIREYLWNMLYRTKVRPTKKEVSEFYEKYSDKIKNIVGDDIKNIALQGQIESLILYFLVPYTSAWDEADPDGSIPTLSLHLKNLTPVFIHQYIEHLGTIHQTIQDLHSLERRMVNPYGAGEDVVIVFVNYFALEKYLPNKLLFESLSCENELDLILKESEIIRTIRKDIGNEISWKMVQTIKILMGNTGNLKTLKTFGVKWKYDGICTYPSAIQLRITIMSHILTYRGFATPKFYPISGLLNIDPQKDSVLFSPLPRHILESIISELVYRRDVSLVCKGILSIVRSLQPSCPLERAQNLNYVWGITKGQASQFVIASALTLGAKNPNDTADETGIQWATKMETEAKGLALFLHYSLPFKRTKKKLIKQLHPHLTIPEHLVSNANSIDWRIIDLVRMALIEYIAADSAKIMSSYFGEDNSRIINNI